MKNKTDRKKVRNHFIKRAEQRLDTIFTKSRMKAIKKKILSKEIGFWGLQDKNSIRTKHLYVHEGQTYVIIYDRKLNELVTIYKYERHLK